MKILFAGSPQAAADTLNILLENQSAYGFEVAGVLSNPPTAKGRHKELTPTPVAALALQKGLPVFTPEHLDSSAREQIQPIGADLLVSFAYGHIFGPKFLALFPMGGINLHPSLLPKYRGCTPVPAAILNRDKQTAVTIQTLALKMDEGNILAQKIVELDGTETGESLLNQSAQIGAELICNLLKNTENDSLPKGKEQTGEPSYTGIITKNDGKINWKESAAIIEAKIRAYYPDPGCWCVENELPLRLLKASYIESTDERVQKYDKNAAEGTVLDFVKQDGIYIKTADGLLVVKELQRQGKKAMNYKDFMNGARDFVGSVLQ